MCLIIDANVVSEVLNPEPKEDYEPLWRALNEKQARLVYGGKLTEEYLRIRHIIGILRLLDQSGAARKVSDAKVNDLTKEVVREGLCISNDHHIIALARLAKVRLLCSKDTDLHTDFTNPRVLKPAGSVYTRKSHQHLIRVHCGQLSCRTKRRGRVRKKR